MDKAIELLENLAEQLGVAVEYLWATLIRQQYVQGVTDIIIAVFGIIVVVLLAIYAPKITKGTNNKYKALAEDRRKNGTGYEGSYDISSCEEDKYELLAKAVPVLSIIVGCIVFLLIVIFIVSGIQQLINPDYFALKEILNTISGTLQ